MHILLWNIHEPYVIMDEDIWDFSQEYYYRNFNAKTECNQVSFFVMSEEMLCEQDTIELGL